MEEPTSPLVREISLFGTPIKVKGYICARNSENYRPKPPETRLQVSILPTRFCPARCPFCIAAPTDDPQRLDPAKLRNTLEALRRANIVRGISITGGEPFTDMKLLDEIIHLVFEIFGDEMELTLDTNGMGISHLSQIRDLMKLDTIHISRHHWEDARNNAIFGRKMPSAEALAKAIRSVGRRDLFVLNCLLLRDSVGTPEAARHYLDFAIQSGAGKVSFITPAPVNPWTRERRVSYEDVLRLDDPALLFTQGYHDFGWCRCLDGVYADSKGRLIEFYGRCTDTGGLDYIRGLVIEPDGTLRGGYGGKVIFLGEE